MLTCRRIFAGLSLLMSSAWATALPVSVTDDDGLPGDTVSTVLSDDAVSQFDAATFQVEWDPLRLVFKEFKLGTLTAADFLPFFVPSAGRLDVSLASAAAPLDGVGGSIAEIVFTILGTAPVGPTPVTFSCTDFGPGLGCVDYAFPPTSGTITVLNAPGPQIPVPAPVWLMASGLPLLVGRRRTGMDCN
ncbi:cohesin domain-containing protein [Plasticicumulans lactativorans]|uniref:Cohesin domain-containing protein n=1 Tax=Plasticicumulans lactativorans TaxID=1133106 RepID=A0A4R2L330_9GAMM|nr:cohesin domain-containing protein [Plasticicumulans lactativorans]TCO80773.1 cohesin domain-containing protein [Plasticicumulans lactativorans]